ncbi:unnamed protein product [Rotaria magnacalcarata]
MAYSLEPNSNTTEAATSTTTRTSDSPPITTRRTGRQYIKCLLIALFAAQTAILLSVLASDFGSFFVASSTWKLTLKDTLFLLFWFDLAIYSVQLVRDAIVDFFIKCCIK